jgi:hypothetical protein
VANHNVVDKSERELKKAAGEKLGGRKENRLKWDNNKKKRKK